MKKLKVWLVSLLCMATFLIASPVLADQIATKSPDYPVIVQNLNDLLTLKADPKQTKYSSQELKQAISELEFQKYILENAEDWGVCRNETGKNLAIYARNPKKGTPSTLFYLADGEETDDNWDCEAVYLPNDAKVASLSIPSKQPVAVKILDGTNLTISSNPDTGELSFNIPSVLTNIVDATDKTFSIPNVTQAEIDAQVSNAPVD